MAISHAASPVDIISSAFSAAGRMILEFFTEVGRARAAKVMYVELAGMSDSELEKMGLQRNEISQTVYASVYDVV